MTNGDYGEMNKYSQIAIEEQDIYFAAIVTGVRRKWIIREQKKRILIK